MTPLTRLQLPHSRIGRLVPAAEDHAPARARAGARGAEVWSNEILSAITHDVFNTVESSSLVLPSGTRRSLHKPWGKKELPV